ncbi:transposase [Nonomuraea sp. 10N515B]|uniref:transposase n=1 Tax=Nonomuraea sp. 10N515B TaxID=3457422 RepID=UPI003FCEBFAF
MAWPSQSAMLRRGKDQHIMIPGWPYSFVVALEAGRSSWTAPLDALRLAPGDDLVTVTATQLREVVERLMAAGQCRSGDPDILILADAGYDGPRRAGTRDPRGGPGEDDGEVGIVRLSQQHRPVLLGRALDIAKAVFGRFLQEVVLDAAESGAASTVGHETGTIRDEPA